MSSIPSLTKQLLVNVGGKAMGGQQDKQVSILVSVLGDSFGCEALPQLCCGVCLGRMGR